MAFFDGFDFGQGLFAVFTGKVKVIPAAVEAVHVSGVQVKHHLPVAALAAGEGVGEGGMSSLELGDGGETSELAEEVSEFIDFLGQGRDIFFVGGAAEEFIHFIGERIGEGE